MNAGSVPAEVAGFHNFRRNVARGHRAGGGALIYTFARHEKSAR